MLMFDTISRVLAAMGIMCLALLAGLHFMRAVQTGSAAATPSEPSLERLEMCRRIGNPSGGVSLMRYTALVDLHRAEKGHEYERVFESVRAADWLTASYRVYEAHDGPPLPSRLRRIVNELNHQVSTGCTGEYCLDTRTVKPCLETS